MPDFAKLLLIFEEQLRIRNALVLSLLSPGVRRNHISEIWEKLNLNFFEEVSILYEWKNGISDGQDKLIGEMLIFPNGIMHTLENAVEHYRENVIRNSLWSSALFPLFSSGGGDHLLINIGTEKSRGKVYLYSPSTLLSDKPVTIYDSLSSLFKSSTECYQKGAYFFENGFFEQDVDLEFEICMKYNPRSEYWKN